MIREDVLYEEVIYEKKFPKWEMPSDEELAEIKVDTDEPKEHLTFEQIIEKASEARDIEVGEYAMKVARTVAENAEELDSQFENYLKRWNKNRISKVSLAILRLAVYNDCTNRVTFCNNGTNHLTLEFFASIFYNTDKRLVTCMSYHSLSVLYDSLQGGSERFVHKFLFSTACHSNNLIPVCNAYHITCGLC